MKPTDPYRRTGRLLLGVLVVYGVLVATHQGEFWPFSIYPMFSSAGKPWSRALVVEAPPEPSEGAWWRETRLDDLPGPILPLDAAGLSQNDLAAFVAQPDAWDDARRQRLRRLLAPALTLNPRLLIYRVRGRLEANSVSVTCTPVLLLTADSAVASPASAPIAQPAAQP